MAAGAPNRVVAVAGAAAVVASSAWYYLRTKRQDAGGAAAAAPRGLVLSYFDARGRGEPIRLMLEDAGVPYEYRTLDAAAWERLKPELPMPALPVLHDGPLVVVHANAITRHLARKHGLYGDSPAEAAAVDMWLDAVEELRSKYLQLVISTECKQPEIAEYMAKAFSPKFPALEALLAKNDGGRGFVVGRRPSAADYSLYDLVDCNLRLNAKLLADFPLMKAWYERMKQRPRLVAYFESGRQPERINVNNKGQ